MMFDTSQYSSVSFNSKNMQKNGIYVAIRGEKFNGENFIEEAIGAGATAVVYDEKSNIAKVNGIEYMPHSNPKKALSELAAQFYPKSPSNIVGVTGTCGKTSVVGFYRQMCDILGYKSASLGTLGVIANDLEIESLASMTTPDPVKLHSVLGELDKEKFTHVAIEVSSHGLSQHRLDSVRFKAGAFTNFSQDHLDYHHDMDEYFNAKMRFFKEVLEPKSDVVLNKDSFKFEAVRNICVNRNMRVTTFGKSDADIIFSKKEQLNIDAHGSSYTVEFPLYAEFQQYNVICALALAIATGVDLTCAISVIPKLQPAVGRLQHVANYRGASIYVDNSHKPEALEKVLIAAREFTSHKLHVLFGCGGDRDKLKRPIMGEIASRLADHITVTDDNPRTEDPNSIRKQILNACVGAIEIGNRREAIRYAINRLSEGDTLIIAGKGHEEYQIIGDIKYRFNDAEEVHKIVTMG